MAHDPISPERGTHSPSSLPRVAAWRPADGRGILAGAAVVAAVVAGAGTGCRGKVADAEPAPRTWIEVRNCEAIGGYERPDDDPDWPEYVRAASGICEVGGRLVFVQDDVSAVVIREPDGSQWALRIESQGGALVYDDERGNRLAKPDLEGCLTLGDEVVVLGSGTTPDRTNWYVINPEARSVRTVDALPLYQDLSEQLGLFSTELNIEGAVAWSGLIWLLQRGNGETTHIVSQRNAMIGFDPQEFRSWIASGVTAPVQSRMEWLRFGRVSGTRLTPTDVASVADGHVLLSLVAESTSSPLEDGELRGLRFALGRPGSDMELMLARDETGRVVLEKFEGLYFSMDRQVVLAVTDPDDPAVPARICELLLPE